MSDEDTFDLTGALPFDADAFADTPQKPGAQVLGGEFAYIGKGLKLEAFRLYVQTYAFGSIPPDYAVLHHTAIPSTLAARYPSGAVWDGHERGLGEAGIYAKRKAQLDQLMRYYRDTKAWDRGPHLFIDERWIWLFTPMAQVGIHAKAGNSYRDRARQLHYSIGIEVVGYYEHVHWSPAVASNVSGAVAALMQRLKTFGYADKPWAGGISAHRHYNKPQCPGAAITPNYYMPILKMAGALTPPPPSPPDATRYRVKAAVTAGATIRAAPRMNGAVLGRLHAGDEWWGTPIEGNMVTLHGFGSNRVWVRDAQMRYVWSGLLEEVKES